MQRRQVSEAHRQAVVRILAGIRGGVYFARPTPNHLQRNKLNSPLSMKEICDKAQMSRRLVRQTVTALINEGIICTSQISFNTPKGNGALQTFYLNPQRVDDYLHYLGDKDIANPEVS